MSTFTVALKNVISRFPGWLAKHRVATRSTAWLVLSIVAFAWAERLTHKIAFVSQVNDASAHAGTILAETKGWYQFAVYGTPETKGQAEVDYDYAPNDTEAVLTFKLPTGTKGMGVWQAFEPQGCHYMGAELGAAGRPLDDTRDNASWAYIDLSSLTLDETHYVTCDVSPHSLSETFTTRVSLFFNRSDPHVGHQFIPLPIRLTITNRDGDFQVIATSAMGSSIEGEVTIPPDFFATVRFRSIRQEQRRDWYLVIIGALVALGATLLLESVRPFIERIGERPTP